MEQLCDSDRRNENPAMLAINAYDNIIDQIRSSNLNFQLQMSPFSAHISLKRSLVKDHSGAYRLPLETLDEKNLQLQKSFDALAADYARKVDDIQEAYKKMELWELEKNTIKKENETEILVENLKLELNKLTIENENYKGKIEEQNENILELERKVKIKNEISNTLNKQLSDLKRKVEEEKALVKKMHKDEVKSWKKDLGDERKQKVKLEKKLENALLEAKPDTTLVKNSKLTSSSTQTEVFSSTYHGCENCEETLESEKSGQVHGNCEHEKQCVLRQPYPPPSPSFPFIAHEVSKYHIHMMNKTKDDLIGCVRCFSVDNENYGCDKCTWLKWWFKWHGDRHGLPDMHPSIYRKYL